MTTAQLTRSFSAGIRKIEGAWIAVAAILAALALLVPGQFQTSVGFTLEALVGIAPFLMASVAFAAFARATGLDGQIGRAFAGRPMQAVVLASVFGALSPFCSCGVVPIIAGLLAAGVPLAPVLAFCLASPLMDPNMFLLTVPVLGLEFAVFKTVAAIAIGIGAGTLTHFAVRSGAFAEPLRPDLKRGSCCKARALKTAPVVLAFWSDAERRQTFLAESGKTGLFLVKWLTLAFLLESLMVAYVPADAVARMVGGGEWWSIPAAVLVGIPAYLNGYAAVPMVGGLIDLGMSPAAAMGFVIAGGITSIPASMAVFALVRSHVFVWYLVLGLAFSMAAAYGFAIYLAWAA